MFYFHSRGNDKLNDLRKAENGLIVLQDWVILRKEYVAAGTAVQCRFHEVAGMRVGTENHGAGSVGDAVREVCDHIVKKLVDGWSSVRSGLGLGGSNGAEHDHSGIMQEGTNISSSDSSCSLAQKMMGQC